MQISSQFYPKMQSITTAKQPRFAARQPVQPLIKREYISPTALEIGDHVLLTWPYSSQTEPMEHVILWTEDKGGIPASVHPSLLNPKHYLMGVQLADGSSTKEEVFSIRKPVQEEDIIRLVKSLK